MTISVRKMVLRPAKPEDAANVFAFYEHWKWEGVVERSEDSLKKAAEQGLLFLIEADRSIVAASGVFDLTGVPYVEVGGTLVEPPSRGFGLQSLLFQIRFAGIVANQGWDPSKKVWGAVTITTAIKPKNRDSLRGSAKAGFVPWSTPIEQCYEPCSGCKDEDKLHGRLGDRKCCCDFFELPLDAARKEIRSLLLETSTAPVSTRKHRDNPSSVVEVIVESPLMRNPYRAALEAFVASTTP